MRIKTYFVHISEAPLQCICHENIIIYSCIECSTLCERLVVYLFTGHIQLVPIQCQLRICMDPMGHAWGVHVRNPPSDGNAYHQRLTVCSVYADQLSTDLIKWTYIAQVCCSEYTVKSANECSQNGICTVNVCCQMLSAGLLLILQRVHARGEDRVVQNARLHGVHYELHVSDSEFSGSNLNVLKDW